MKDDRPLWMDTWGWYALADQDEAQHTKVKEIYRNATAGQIKTSDFILDETITLLFRKLSFASAGKFITSLFSATQQGFIQLIWVTPPVLEEAWNLRLRYTDKPRISFTDLTSMVLMREYGIAKVITHDAHFTHTGFGFELLP